MVIRIYLYGLTRVYRVLISTLCTLVVIVSRYLILVVLSIVHGGVVVACLNNTNFIIMMHI